MKETDQGQNKPVHTHIKVSVITVCRNSVDTLSETIKSVSSQTWPHLEHIIIDGASVDGTQDLIRRSQSGRMRAVSEPDQGIYDAMNKGLRMSTGDIIAFLGADDIYTGSGVIARVVDLINSRQLDVLLGDAVFYDQQNPQRIVRRYDSSRFSPARIAWGWMPAHTAMFMRRKVYEEVGPFRTDYRIAGDFEYIARAFWKKNLRYEHLPEVLVRMRLGGISTGGLRNTILLNREVLRACRDNNIPTNIFKIISKYPAKLLEFIRS